jgi:nitrite reductase (NO-forming)
LFFSCGEGNKPAATGTNQPMNDTALGEIVYNRTCVVCHQGKGEGVPGSFPPLAKSDYLTDRAKVIRQVLKGSSGEIKVNGVTYNNTMPPQLLNDEEVAHALTYVYANWGNNGARVTVDEVKAEKNKN